MTVRYSVTVVFIFTGYLMHISLDSAVTSWKIMISHSAASNAFLMKYRNKSVRSEKIVFNPIPKTPLFTLRRKTTRNMRRSIDRIIFITLCTPKVPKGSGLLVFVSTISTSLSSMRSLPCGKALGM